MPKHFEKGPAMCHSRERGSILIYSLLIMATVLAIGLSLNTVFIRNIQNVGQARESIVALYAADTGTELCLYEARSALAVDRAEVQLQEGSVFIITNLADDSDVTADCLLLGSGSFNFRATGTFRRSSRALEIGQ